MLVINEFHRVRPSGAKLGPVVSFESARFSSKSQRATDRWVGNERQAAPRREIV